MVARNDEKRAAHEALIDVDVGLGPLLQRHGPLGPFSWAGEHVANSAVSGLALRIVAQQISTPAAVTIFGRLHDMSAGELTPSLLSSMDIADLRTVGLSQATSNALRPLGHAIMTGDLDLDLASLQDTDERFGAPSSATGWGLDGSNRTLADLPRCRRVGPVVRQGPRHRRTAQRTRRW